MKAKLFRLSAVIVVVVSLVLATGYGLGIRFERHVGKFAGGDPDEAKSSETTPGEGPAEGFEAYLAAQRTYPAEEIPPALSAQAGVTFNAIAQQDAKKGDPNSKGHKWALVGPLDNATQPGVTSFSGATNNTASRTTALLVDPNCGKSGNGVACRVWAGASGGGVWRTDNALVDNPKWNQLKPQGLDQNTVGVLSMDPTDKKNNTIVLEDYKSQPTLLNEVKRETK